MFGSVAILLGISVGSHAYVLDGSCDPYKAMVIKGMQSAFDMSSAASFLLGTIPQQSKSDPVPLSSDRFSFQKHTFYNTKSNPLYRYWSTLGGRKRLNILFVLPNINRWRHESVHYELGKGQTKFR